MKPLNLSGRPTKSPNTVWDDAQANADGTDETLEAELAILRDESKSIDERIEDMCFRRMTYEIPYVNDRQKNFDREMKVIQYIAEMFAAEPEHPRAAMVAENYRKLQTALKEKYDKVFEEYVPASIADDNAYAVPNLNRLIFMLFGR